MQGDIETIDYSLLTIATLAVLFSIFLDFFAYEFISYLFPEYIDATQMLDKVIFIAFFIASSNILGTYLITNKRFSHIYLIKITVLVFVLLFTIYVYSADLLSIDFFLTLISLIFLCQGFMYQIIFNLLTKKRVYSLTNIIIYCIFFIPFIFDLVFKVYPVNVFIQTTAILFAILLLLFLFRESFNRKK